MKRVTRALGVLALAGALAVTSACSGGPAPADPSRTLTIATVDNGDLERLRELSQAFTDEHPGTTLEWVVQGENEVRQTISTDVGTGGGRFDVVTVGTYEARIWADKQLLAPLVEMPEGFDAEGFIPTVREALSYEGTMQAAPFYGESIITMYRTDVFEQVGLEMPERPTWDFILEAATTVSEQTDVNGVCLRGKPGWGENIAFLSAMAHAYGARWFDEGWVPQLDSPEWDRVTEDYLALAAYAPADVASNGYLENVSLFQDGQCAIWVDATSAASFLTDPGVSLVAEDVDFAYAPTHESGTPTSWLWAWSLAIPESADNKTLAREFVAWATSEEYTELVAAEYGWANVPPGTRTALYDNPQYIEAAPFAPLVLEAIESADVEQPATRPVPYVGIQYVAMPEFQSIGTAVGQQMTDAITGDVTRAQALENSQWVTDNVIGRTRMLHDQTNGE